MNPIAAAVAFFALGVTVFGTVLLVMFNPRSAAVRWFAAFQLTIAVWLAAQGWALGIGGWPRALPLVSGSVHMMPAMFLAFAIHDGKRGWPASLAAIAVGLALLPLDLASLTSRRYELLLMLWNLGGWGLATAMVMHDFRKGRSVGRQRRQGYWLLAGLVVVFPMGVLAGLTRGAVVLYVMPLLMVWVQVLIFVGVVRLRFYDIEVRAVRTGELAAATAERERLAVLGELAASLAHEVRNPLTGVRSLAQRLAEDEVNDEKRRKYAGVILEESARVERLVANLLGIARRAPRAGAAERTPLAPLFEDLALLTQGRADRAQVRLAADDARTTADAPREPLAQALLNLLLNAVNHSPAGGTVTLAARDTGRGTLLSVSDQGPGVPEGERDRIWEAFHTGGDGTGLGLAVVRRLAEEEGWTLDVTDAPGGGAMFTVLIPAATR